MQDAEAISLAKMDAQAAANILAAMSKINGGAKSSSLLQHEDNEQAAAKQDAKSKIMAQVDLLTVCSLLLDIYVKHNQEYYEIRFQLSINSKIHLKETSGDIYVGEFKDDKQHGQGIYTCANGDKYEGEWEDGKRHGQGIYTWANGNSYDGKWVNGQFSFTDGIILAWNTALSDNHTIVFPWGDRYEGEFKDGKCMETALMKYANGDTYVGEWVNGKPHGQGIYI